jgi:hypothetical protein
VTQTENQHPERLGFRTERKSRNGIKGVSLTSVDCLRYFAKTYVQNRMKKPFFAYFEAKSGFFTPLY